MDPLKVIVETIVPPIVLSGLGVVANFEVSSELYNQLGKKNHSVELRCVRLDGSKNMNETTWPDSGECVLNSHRLKEFTPLQQNSSLKKRKDEKLVLKDVSLLHKGSNVLNFKENIHSPYAHSQHHKAVHYRIKTNTVHVLAFFLVKKLPHTEFFASLPILSEEESK